jgi:hypothetical protein
MDATLNVPAGFVRYLRSGLFGELGSAAEKMSTLAQQFGSGAPDGVYMLPLQNIITVWALLGEVGWKDLPTESDVVVNLGVGAPHLVNALKEEHRTLVLQLDEMPSSMNKRIRDAASANAAGLAEFIKSVEAQAARARRRRHKPAPIHPTSRPPLSARARGARRAEH